MANEQNSQILFIKFQFIKNINHYISRQRVILTHQLASSTQANGWQMAMLIIKHLPPSIQQISCNNSSNSSSSSRMSTTTTTTATTTITAIQCAWTAAKSRTFPTQINGLQMLPTRSLTNKSPTGVGQITYFSRQNKLKK